MRCIVTAAILAGAVAWSGSAHAYALELGKTVYCDPGFGIGGSNINYAHAYLDGFCLSPKISHRDWAPGPILGIESGLIGTSFAGGIALVGGTDHALTLPMFALVARGRFMYPWGIMGWERSPLYGGEIGIQSLFFRATIGMLWRHGEADRKVLFSFDIGLL